MKKLLKQEDGMILVAVIILATVGIILFTAMANLALQNYRTIHSSNTKSSVYYIADYGVERVLKNLETIVQSAKIYADEKIRMGSDYDNITAGTLDYKTQFETYFRDYLSTKASITNPTPAIGDVATVLTTNYSSFNPPIPGLPDAEYRATVTKSANFNNDYTLIITVTGDNDGKFTRTVKSQIGISPWGYNNVNTGVTSTITPTDNSIYSSPQWASAIASSGDVLVSGGTVTVNGDIYVNGKGYDGKINGASSDPTTGLPFEGTMYGGLVVGDASNYLAGNLTVNGNIFSNNYVHTVYPGSQINVQRRNPSTISINGYNLTIDKIYQGNDPYSENSANLNNVINGADCNPLGLDFNIINNAGLRETNSTYAEYVKNTFGIQKENGGFIYARDLQVEKSEDGLGDTSDQQISVDGSTIVYNNLEIDNKGSITINNNFYGFMDSVSDFNQSSSIITNDVNGQINIWKRVYNAGAAFVTAFEDSNSNGVRELGEEFYKTGETASLNKNFYAYKYYLDSVPIPSRTGGATGSYTENPLTSPSVFYNPFTLIDFEQGQDYAKKMLSTITHILGYDYANPLGVKISDGGLGLDKQTINLNREIYSDSNLTDSSKDMGYTNGVLMGTTSTGTFTGFMGYPDTSDSSPETFDPVGFINYYRAKNSLATDAFNWYIAGKYSILTGIKVLKYTCDGGSQDYILSLRDLVDTSKVSGQITNIDTSGMGASYIVNGGGDINITAGSGLMTIKYGDGTVARTITLSGGSYKYDGLIWATGKVTITNNDAGNKILINGAVISTNSTDNTGIEFKGVGAKEINYNQNGMLNVFKLSTPDAQNIKTALASKRGIVEMFKRIYAYQKYIEDNGLTGDTYFKQGVDKYATSKSIPLSGAGSDSCDVTVNGHTVSVPVAAITAVANFYENYDASKPADSVYNDKVVLYQNVLGQLLTQGSNNYKIITWGETS